MYEYSAFCTNVVDGDTIDVIVDLGFTIKFNIRIRLYGINAYENKHVKSQTEEETQKGKDAEDYLTNLIYGRNINVKTHMDKKGKYGRYLADIYIHGENINKKLVDLGYAIYQ